MPDNLILLRILDTQQPSLPILLRLYEDTFPPEERRRPQDLVACLKMDNMHFMEIKENDQSLGFIIYWEFEHFRFVEHFAVFPEYRSRDAGSRVLQQLMNTNRPLLLEVEQPADYTSHRRIAFYLRNGLHLLNVPYFQPPYHREQAPLSMRLMSDKPLWQKDELKAAIQAVHRSVYNIKG